MLELEDLNSLVRETGEMNQQKLEHCGRCHSAIKSDTYSFDPKRPVIFYEPPKRCNVCKSTNYDESEIVEAYLPTEEDGILCKCKYPGCEKEFWNRPKWYLRQQEIVLNTRNPFMPELADTDPERLKRIDCEPELASK